MPRSDKKAYFQIGFEEGSPLLEQIRKDATWAGTSIPMLIFRRITEWYTTMPQQQQHYAAPSSSSAEVLPHTTATSTAVEVLPSNSTMVEEGRKEEGGS